MADTPGRLWFMRLVYLGLALFLICLHLLPLTTLPPRFTPPDLLLGLTLAWALRRPEQVPVLAIAAVMLLADLMFLRPPGLFAALVVIGSEWLKRRIPILRESGFASEWGAVALAVLGMLLANRLALGLLVVQQAPLRPHLVQAGLTIATYPLVVLFVQGILGVRRAAPRPRGRAGA
ncbi:rod shape-determining protein MreD [Pontibaca methylaminivorans]|uniref:rod shape-determining protein MreD n=1 Tax=Pontibaca methylaminivorans TaxID=515897 RepID=UPI002FDA30ED